MWGVLGLKSFSYWPRSINPSTTQDFWHHWLFSHMRICCRFTFLLLFLDVWVYKQKILLGSSMLLLSASLHSQAVSALLVGWVGHPWLILVLVEDEGVLDGKDACYIMVRAIFQPPSSGGRVTSLDKLFLRTDAPLIVGSGCLSGLYLSLCFDWKFSPCDVTIMFALGIIPFLQL